jgi:hypothetical protein
LRYRLRRSHFTRMPAVAKTSPEWRKRILLMSFFGVASGIWFFYDGLIDWPRKNAIAREYQRLKDEKTLEQWPKIAAEHGWPTKEPGRVHEDYELVMQVAIGTVLTLAGCAGFARFLLVRNRVLRSDEEAVYSPTGLRVPYSAMTRIDKRAWDSKGIAVVSYTQDGKRRTLKIDDFIFHGGDAVLRDVEANAKLQQGG